MRLVIQTNVPGQLGVWIVAPAGKIRAQAIRQIQYHGSERLLAIVDAIMDSAQIRPNQVSRITVVRGPGPFTAVRTGLVVANTLSWLWVVPVVGVVRETLFQPQDFPELYRLTTPRTFKPVRPWYGREPNITLPKQASWA